MYRGSISWVPVSFTCIASTLLHEYAAAGDCPVAKRLCRQVRHGRQRCHPKTIVSKSKKDAILADIGIFCLNCCNNMFLGENYKMLTVRQNVFTGNNLPILYILSKRFTFLLNQSDISGFD